jgi:hypothetical protein
VTRGEAVGRATVRGGEDGDLVVVPGVDDRP